MANSFVKEALQNPEVREMMNAEGSDVFGSPVARVKATREGKQNTPWSRKYYKKLRKHLRAMEADHDFRMKNHQCIK